MTCVLKEFFIVLLCARSSIWIYKIQRAFRGEIGSAGHRFLFNWRNHNWKGSSSTAQHRDGDSSQWNWTTCVVQRSLLLRCRIESWDWEIRDRWGWRVDELLCLVKSSVDVYLETSAVSLSLFLAWTNNNCPLHWKHDFLLLSWVASKCRFYDRRVFRQMESCFFFFQVMAIIMCE